MGMSFYAPKNSKKMVSKNLLITDYNQQQQKMTRWFLRRVNRPFISMYGARNLEMSIRFSLKSRPSERFHRPEMSQIKAEISLHTNVKLCYKKSANPLISLQSYIFMTNQLHVGTKADLSFYLRHFWPMKSFRRPRF